MVIIGHTEQTTRNVGAINRRHKLAIGKEMQSEHAARVSSEKCLHKYNSIGTRSSTKWQVNKWKN